MYHHLYPRNAIHPRRVESSPLNAAIISRVAFSFSTLFTSFGIRKVHLRYIASIFFAESQKKESRFAPLGWEGNCKYMAMFVHITNQLRMSSTDIATIKWFII